DIAAFKYGVVCDLTLQGEVILVSVRSSQTRIDYKDIARAANRQEARCGEIDIGRRWARGEGIRCVCRRERLSQVIHFCRGIAGKRQKLKSRIGVKRGLSIELQIVLGLQDVVKHAESPTQA